MFSLGLGLTSNHVLGIGRGGGLPVMGATSYLWTSGGNNCVFSTISYNCTGVIKVKCYHETASVWKESGWSSPPATGEATFGFNDMVVDDDYSQFQVIYDCTGGTHEDSDWVMVRSAMWTQPSKRDPAVEENWEE